MDGSVVGVGTVSFTESRLIALLEVVLLHRGLGLSALKTAVGVLSHIDLPTGEIKQTRKAERQSRAAQTSGWPTLDLMVENHGHGPYGRQRNRGSELRRKANRTT